MIHFPLKMDLYADEPHLNVSHDAFIERLRTLQFFARDVPEAGDSIQQDF